MALPVTITGISTAVATVGPFKSSGGNYYFFGRDGTTATTLQAFKSTAPDTSWASVATKTGFTTAILNLAAYQVGDVIHLAVQDGTMSSSVATRYLSFNMATDTFLATTETVLAASALTGSAASGWDCSLVVRSNGEVVAFYNGLQTKTSGTFYARVYYSRRTAVNTWSAAVQVDANIAGDNVFSDAVLGGSDSVHFFFAAGGALRQRTLSAANALQTIVNGVGNGPYKAISYDSGGVIKCVVSTAGSGVQYFDSGNTPTVTAGAVFGTNVTDPKGLFNDGPDLWVVYRNSVDSDLYANKSTTVGSTWQTATNIFTATVAAAAANLSVNGNIYQRGASVVVPYIVNDGGTLKYNEYLVRTLTTTGTLSEVEDPDTASIAGVAVLPDVTGTLSEIEDPDVAVSTGGKVDWLATLATVEVADTAVSTGGKVDWRASLATIEAVDVLAVTGPVTKTFFNPAKTSTHLVLSSSNLTMTRAVDAVTWNPADIGSSGTLDGTNLVFTSGTDTGFTYTAVRATASASAGKFYSEHVVNVDVGRPLQVGLFNALRPLNSANGALSDGSLGAAIAYDSTGYIVTCAGAAASGLTTWTTGDRIGMAVDLDGSTIKWRKNGGSWTSDYSLSPLSVCAGTPTAFPAMVHARFVDTPAQTTTANFGPTFVDTPPSGYGAWG